MRRPIKYQIIKLKITGVGSFPINAETDKAYKLVTGVHYSSSDQVALKDTEFGKLEIDSNEIFGQGHEVKMITTGEDVPPDNRYYTLNERAEGTTIAGSIIDAGNAAVYPYNARIYLRLENPLT